MEFLKRAKKLAKISRSPRYITGLRYGVAAAVEHEPVLKSIDCRTVIDVGANRGQFSLVSRECYPAANIYAYEPLTGPAMQFRRLFENDSRVMLNEMAISPDSGLEKIHISARDDSSSLMTITPLQSRIFPGTEEVSTQFVQVGPLTQTLTVREIANPALLKIDVQGYEMQVLHGCAELLDLFAYVYVECSFVELYAGQGLADEVILFLQNKDYVLNGVYNMTYDRNGCAIQGDFLFARPDVENA